MACTLKNISYRCTADDSLQPAQVLASASQRPRPLVVVLHTWSGDWRQNLGDQMDEAARYDWHAIEPDFRGPNRHPDACGSAMAMRDILDAVDWAITHLKVDEDRIYLTGGSGGGHMTLQTACHHSRRFAAASAWCSITDLAAWHREHVKDGQADNYARDIEASVGGKPGDSAEVDRQLHARSSLFHIQGAANLPLDICHGVHDGKRGSVPFRHSIDAFNVLARLHGVAPVSEREMRELDQQGRLSKPQPGDIAGDPTFNVDIHLRRVAGLARLTIFEGGHTILPAAAFAWLAPFTRSGKSVSDAMPLPASPGGVVDIGR
ncbi:MAG: prolyl oligopeptidase family serine peptidase [Phycisphaeraceae bacterium]|nr:prolyl oligopeptidase family serine peptidase [Phycisphaeraceae bacterium]